MQGPRQPSHSAHALAIPELHLPPAASSSSSSDDKPQHDHLPRHEREAAASRRRVKTRRRSRRRRRTPGDDVDDDVSKDGRSFARVLSSLRRHAAFVGPGIVASVAYIGAHTTVSLRQWVADWDPQTRGTGLRVLKPCVPLSCKPTSRGAESVCRRTGLKLWLCALVHGALCRLGRALVPALELSTRDRLWRRCVAGPPFLESRRCTETQEHSS